MGSFKDFIENPGLRNIITASFIMLIIFSLGSLGYHLIEDMTWFEGLYMTFITISTIGF